MTSLVGNSLTITCPYEGTDDSRVTWMVDKQPIKFSKRITKTADNSLRIENLKFYDSGLYMCKVWNAEGKDSETTLLTISGIISTFRPCLLFPWSVFCLVICFLVLYQSCSEIERIFGN